MLWLTETQFIDLKNHELCIEIDVKLKQAKKAYDVTNYAHCVTLLIGVIKNVRIINDAFPTEAVTFKQNIIDLENIIWYLDLKKSNDSTRIPSERIEKLMEITENFTKIFKSRYPNSFSHNDQK